MNRARIHEIRDPIHGAIRIDQAEYSIVSHFYVQRLRRIRQLGFSQVPFPGATHTRFCHSIGVMHLAGQAFDSVFHEDRFSDKHKRKSLRYCLRMAALLHDVGHAPFSHAAEFAMPMVAKVNPDSTESRRATHEDYTVAILCHSSLSDALSEVFDFSGKHIAALIDPGILIEDDFFKDGEHDLRGILSQLISSNLDLDRLDYLIRDSYFSGVRYGQVDVHWLINHMGKHINRNGKMILALDRVALYAFEDFLHSRLQMFLNIYFHRKSVGFELMLQQHMGSQNCEYRLPSDLDEYMHVDDAHLWNYLRSSKDEYARRVVEYRPFKVAIERHGTPASADLSVREQGLEAGGIFSLRSASVGLAFSEPKSAGNQIMILGRDLEGERKNIPLGVSILKQSRIKACISRIYVPEKDLRNAQKILSSMETQAEQQTFL